MSNPTIYIIGTGAIGKALAVFLKRDNKNVILVRGSVDDKPVEHTTFRVELSDKIIQEATIEVNTFSNLTTLDGIVVLTNKSFGNEHLSQTLRGKIGNSPMVVLQNGLGVEQPFIDNDEFTNIFRCILFATSQTLTESTLRFKPVAVSPIGTIKGDETKLNYIVKQLDNFNFPFKAVADIQPIIWKKAIANSVFNSVCPLLDIDNGIFHRNEAALGIAKRVIEECTSVAKKMGITLSVEDVIESLLMISKSSDGQLISTLQDIKNKRRTEIDTLNFSIVAMAKKLGMEEVVKETRLLGELTKLKSEMNQ
jgi:2-dehydropantoate 2-reductase